MRQHPTCCTDAAMHACCKEHPAEDYCYCKLVRHSGSGARAHIALCICRIGSCAPGEGESSASPVLDRTSQEVWHQYGPVCAFSPYGCERLSSDSLSIAKSCSLARGTTSCEPLYCDHWLGGLALSRRFQVVRLHLVGKQLETGTE